MFIFVMDFITLERDNKSSAWRIMGQRITINWVRGVWAYLPTVQVVRGMGLLLINEYLVLRQGRVTDYITWPTDQ